jgi:hypothetical protein
MAEDAVALPVFVEPGMQTRPFSEESLVCHFNRIRRHRKKARVREFPGERTQVDGSFALRRKFAERDTPARRLSAVSNC